MSRESTTMHYLVTGARSGIGAATLGELKAAGHRVHGWDLPEHDITDPEGVEKAVADLEAEHGPLDALIHTAGTLRADAALSPDHAALHHSLAVNLLGTVNICSAVARRMRERGEGAIVAVSSNAAATPRVGMATYGASKAAASSWLRTLGLECAPHGVRCNIVTPGSTDTPMLRGMWREGHDERAGVIAGTPEQFRLGIPLGRVAEPEDIAQACIFLTSPAARHITMHDLRVDGGATLDQ